MIITNTPNQAIQNEKDIKKPNLADSKKGLFSKQAISKDQISEIDRKLQNLTNKLLDSLRAGKTAANFRTIDEASNTKVAPNLLKDIKDLTKTIQNEPKLQEIASKLEKFLKPVESMKSSTMAQSIKNSGILLEAKISETLQNSEFPVKIKELISLMKNTNSQNLKEAFLTLPNDDNIEKNLSDLERLLAQHKNQNLKIIEKSPFKSLLDISSKLENIAKFIDKSLNNLDPKTAAKIIDLLDVKLEQSAKILNSLNLNDPNLRHAKFLRTQINNISSDLGADIKFIKGQSEFKGTLFQNSQTTQTNQPNLNTQLNQSNLNQQPNLANQNPNAQVNTAQSNLNQPNLEPNNPQNQANLNTQNQPNQANQPNSQTNLNQSNLNQQPNLANQNPNAQVNTAQSNLNQPNLEPNNPQNQANLNTQNQPNQANQPNSQTNLNQQPNLTNQNTNPNAQNQPNLNPQNQVNSQLNLNQSNLPFVASPKVLPQNINLANFTDLSTMQPNSVNLQNKLINISHKITNIINTIEPDTIGAKNTLGEIRSLFRATGHAKNQISQIIQTSFESNAKNLQNDLKSVLLNLKELSSKDTNLRGVNQTANRLITQIEINQLISYTQNSLQTHLPYTWDALESSSLTFKRGQKDKFYARIELNFVKHGSVSVMIGLFDLKYIDVSITTSHKDFKNTILKNAKDLKRALNSQGLIVNSFYLSQKSQSEPYQKNAVMELGYNIKA